jgi:hypothetical protein
MPVSRQTEGLTGNPGVPDAGGRHRGFPIGRFAAAGNDITESISRISYQRWFRSTLSAIQTDRILKAMD